MSALTCDYLERDAHGWRQPCGQPATHWRNGRGGQFCYCELHARVVDENTRGKHNITKIPTPLRS